MSWRCFAWNAGGFAKAGRRIDGEVGRNGERSVGGRSVRFSAAGDLDAGAS